jgi:hypothetical protein
MLRSGFDETCSPFEPIPALVASQLLHRSYDLRELVFHAPEAAADIAANREKYENNQARTDQYLVFRQTLGVVQQQIIHHSLSGLMDLRGA